MGKTKKQPKPRKTLLERLYTELQKSPDNEKKEIEWGSFSDNSASWIEIKPKERNLQRGWDVHQSLVFNGAGTKLVEVKSFKITYSIIEETQIIQ